MTKKQKLLNWCKYTGIFATHDVNIWGVQNYFGTAERQCRRFREEGKLRRLTKKEKENAGYVCKDDAYEYVGAGLLLEDNSSDKKRTCHSLLHPSNLLFKDLINPSRRDDHV